ncbi:hypothetical protein KFL_001040330 [Klebsormidium nitens]|uniref:Uncharacterized protein n=1 Tax=Klebsormidium nitens TaxID=105231 RepID=A0A1Y1HUC0_KLENI|nr:hypothetical protein KFL_001040330 [Klebsormidium nitens]|eukprot:GAQ82230.1 hypothetical protein KFL_001040330 [Klebsormidium nitens]
MATFFPQRAASLQSLHHNVSALSQPLQQTAGSSTTTAASLSFQTCHACKRSFLTPQFLSVFSLDSRRNRTKFGVPKLAGHGARRKEHNQLGLAVRALQNEGEALEKVRSQLEEQLSKSSPTVGAEAGKAGFDKWPQLLLILFAIGTVSGPLLDGIHSVTGLQVYDDGAIELGSGKYLLKTDIWVFPLLGVFYAVVGGLYPLLDDIFTPKALEKTDAPDEEPDVSGYGADWGLKGDPKAKELPPWLEVAPPFQFMFLAFLLSGSAFLYRTDISYDVIWLVLAGSCVGCWAALDSTWWGFLLAAACAVVAPGAELVLNNFFHLWHYPRADVFIAGQGVVSWVALCYFFYCPPLGNLGRFLKAHLQGQLPLKR